MAQTLPYPILPEILVSGKSDSVDTDIWSCFQDPNGKSQTSKGPYREILARLKKSEAFFSKASTTEFVRFGGKNGAQSVLLIGMGLAKDHTEEKARVAGAATYNRLKNAQVKNAAFWIDSLDEGKSGLTGQKFDLTRAFVEGLLLSHYQFEHRKGATAQSSKKTSSLETLRIITSDKSLHLKLEKELDEVRWAVFATNVTRHWSNEPSNIGTPEFYALEASRLAKQFGLKARVLTERDCQRERMDLFLAVGQGSARESRVVILEHTPKGRTKDRPKTIALVGKGVTFDSGGISIKPSMRMEEMKHDMTGAATVMGAMVLAAKLKIPHHVVGVMAFTENMPDGEAIQPGNVINTRAGKTVEIVNTDAEGRLVLADALDLAQDYKPDVILDLATLTGAVSVALGKICCGILGNDDGLVETLKKIGDRTGERLWQLPLYDEYFEDMRSEVADMKNSVNDSNGGTIRGAIFLKQFIKKGTSWAHLDIANVAYNVSHVAYHPRRGATGAMVRLLGHFLKSY
mgnify:CR=1 FL=1